MKTGRGDSSLDVETEQPQGDAPIAARDGWWRGLPKGLRLGGAARARRPHALQLPARAARETGNVLMQQPPRGSQRRDQSEYSFHRVCVIRLAPGRSPVPVGPTGHHSLPAGRHCVSVAAFRRGRRPTRDHPTAGKFSLRCSRPRQPAGCQARGPAPLVANPVSGDRAIQRTATARKPAPHSSSFATTRAEARR